MKLKIGDKVKVLRKEKIFPRTNHPAIGKIGFITGICGNPYAKEDLSNYFIIGPTPDYEGGDFFAPDELELVKTIPNWKEILRRK